MGRRRTVRRRLLAAGVAVLGVTLVGCLDERPGDDDPHLGEPTPFVEVELTSDGAGDHVVPPVVHLVDGGTVEWTVVSGIHDTTAYHPATHGDQQRLPDTADPWASGPLSGGDSYDRVFDAEGVYDYACTRHGVHGAVGTVVVGWPDPDEEPALEPPSDGYPDEVASAIERINDRVRDVLEAAHE